MASGMVTPHPQQSGHPEGPIYCLQGYHTTGLHDMETLLSQIKKWYSFSSRALASKHASLTITHHSDQPRKICDQPWNIQTLYKSTLKMKYGEKRVIGPFEKGMIPLAQINRFGVIPKSHQPHKWQLIVDLSYPRANSVNDGVPKDLHVCSMIDVTIDDAIMILELGSGALLAKIDIKSAFRLIPVYPADRHLLAMEWEGKVLIDTCLPFGHSSYCASVCCVGPTVGPKNGPGSV